MSYLDFPNDTHYDTIGNIPNGNTMFETDRDEELDQLKYTFFPDPELTKLNGSYRIGVKLVRKFIGTISLLVTHTVESGKFRKVKEIWNHSHFS